MKSRICNFILVVGIGVIAVGCSTRPSRVPTAPSSTGATEVVPQASSHSLALTAVVGAGDGMFNLTHTESDRNGFISDAQITISVHGVSPNTVLYLQRAGDVGLPADGICQRANAGLFSSFPIPSGEPGILETSAGGAGAAQFHLFGNVAEGTTIDTMYRLVDALPPAVATIDLRTPCFTFTVK